MTISISSKQELNNAKSRLQAACDELGIRLGKGDKNAQKLVCALLNQPNWHVAVAKVDASELNDPTAKFNKILVGVLEQDLCKSLPRESYIKSMLNEYLNIGSYADSLVTLSASLQVLEITLGAMLSSPSEPVVRSAIASVARDFCKAMLDEMIDDTPAQIQNQLQEIISLLTPK